MENKLMIGILFALAAAMLNASIGLISLILIHTGLSPEDIAFFKTVIAYLIITVILFRVPAKQQTLLIHPKKNLKKLLVQITLCSLLGIFTLFFFETLAYKYGSPPNVVVTLMASAALSTLFLGSIVLKEKISLHAILGSILAISGIAIISWKGETTLLLLINASLAGLGYGCFSILVKKYQLNGGIFLTRYLLMFGSIFLAIPFVLNMHPIHFTVEMFTGVVCLAIFPTILGFYCTTKALKYLSASKVQVTELSEPIFSTLLTFLVFQTLPNYSFILGSILILFGIILINEIKLHHFSSKKV